MVILHSQSEYLSLFTVQSQWLVDQIHRPVPARCRTVVASRVQLVPVSIRPPSSRKARLVVQMPCAAAPPDPNGQCKYLNYSIFLSESRNVRILTDNTTRTDEMLNLIYHYVSNCLDLCDTAKKLVAMVQAVIWKFCYQATRQKDGGNRKCE